MTETEITNYQGLSNSSLRPFYLQNHPYRVIKYAGSPTGNLSWAAPNAALARVRLTLSFASLLPFDSLNK